MFEDTTGPAFMVRSDFAPAPLVAIDAVLPFLEMPAAPAARWFSTPREAPAPIAATARWGYP